MSFLYTDYISDIKISNAYHQVEEPQNSIASFDRLTFDCQKDIAKVI